MDFKRKTKRLSGLPVAFYAVALFLFVCLFFAYTSFYKASTEIEEAEITDSINSDFTETETLSTKPITEAEIYIPEIEMPPSIDTVKIVEEKKPVKEEKTEEKKLAKSKEKTDKKTSPKEEENTKSEKEKITKIGTERKLTAFIPGTMGKDGKLPNHNCKTKGELVMFITIDKAGNVTNAGRSSGIKDACNITAAVIWLKQYVKAKKSQYKSQGTYTIKF